MEGEKLAKFKIRPKRKRTKVSEDNIREWNEIEDLVMTYQKYLTSADSALKKISQDAAAELLNRFNPLFNKYIAVIRTGKINFKDVETKKFLATFIGNHDVRMSLKNKAKIRIRTSAVSHNFAFIRENYGRLPESEILIDLQIILLNLAKRYRQTGRNFCAYIYNAFCYEVSRHVKSFIKSVDNIRYKKTQYLDNIQTEDVAVEENFDDKLYENNLGLPDSSWIMGQNCSEIFALLDPLDRKILVKYYLEGCGDGIIGEALGLSISSVHKRRTAAVKKLADALGKDSNEVVRHRQCTKSKFI